MAKSVRAAARESKGREPIGAPDMDLAACVDRLFAFAGWATFTDEQRKAARLVVEMVRATIVMTPSADGVRETERVLPGRGDALEKDSVDRWARLEKAAGDLTGASSSDAKIQAVSREVAFASEHRCGPTFQRVADRLALAGFPAKSLEQIDSAVKRRTGKATGGRGNAGPSAVVAELTGQPRKKVKAALSRGRMTAPRRSRAKP